MLLEIRSRTEWRMALKETQITPDLIYFHFSIRQEMEAKFPESPIRVFTYPEHGNKKYWFMLKDNLFIDAYCMIAHVASTSFIADEFIECLREFRLRAFGSADSERPHLLIGKEKLVKLYSGLMKKYTSNLMADDLCLNLFYMDRNQEEMSLQITPKIPHGYEVSDISAYEEADLVNSTWKFAKDGDIEQTATKLARLPSACIRYKGDLVAFEMVDPAGFFNNQFVFEDHRRKGLGTAVELLLAQKCVRNQMTPYKTVYKGNKAVLENSCKVGKLSWLSVLVTCYYYYT